MIIEVESFSEKDTRGIAMRFGVSAFQLFLMPVKGQNSTLYLYINIEVFFW